MNTAYLWVVVLAPLGFSGALGKSCSFSPANYTYLEENVFIYFDEDSDTTMLEYAMTFVNASGVENNTHLNRTRIFRTQQDGAFYLAVAYNFFKDVYRKFMKDPYTKVDVSLEVSPADCFENITISETDNLLIDYLLKDFNTTNHQHTPDIHICKTEVDDQGNTDLSLLKCCKQVDAGYFTCLDVGNNLWINLYSNILFVMCFAYEVIYVGHQLTQDSFTICRLSPLQEIQTRHAEDGNAGTADGNVQGSMGQTSYIDLIARKSQLLPAGGSSAKATQFLLPEYLMFKFLLCSCTSSKVKLLKKCIVSCLKSFLYIVPVLFVTIVTNDISYAIVIIIFVISRIVCFVIFKDNIGCVVNNMLKVIVFMLLNNDVKNISLKHLRALVVNKVYYVFVTFLLLSFTIITVDNTQILTQIVTSLFITAIRYTDYTSKILPSALVVIFYIYDTFRGVDQKYATFLDKLVEIIKEKIKTGELVCVQNENIELKNTMVQYAPASVAATQRRELHSFDKVGKETKYEQAYLLMVTDDMSFKYISKEFFFKCCLINCAGAPGGLIENYGKATFYLILKLLFVAHVFVAMMLYGEIVETSPMGQWLLTLVSCLSPIITKLLVAKATGSEKINTDYKRFEKKLMKTITKFSQIWDIEGSEKAKTVETDQYTLRQRGSERTALVSNAYESYT